MPHRKDVPIAWWQAACEKSPYAMLAVTSDHVIRWANDAFARLVHYSPAELVNGRRTWKDLTHPDDVGADLSSADLLIRGDRDQYAMRKRYLTRDGQIVHVELCAFVVEGVGDAETVWMFAGVREVAAGPSLEAIRSDLERRLADAERAFAERCAGLEARVSWLEAPRRAAAVVMQFATTHWAVLGFVGTGLVWLGSLALKLFSAVAAKAVEP